MNYILSKSAEIVLSEPIFYVKNWWNFFFKKLVDFFLKKCIKNINLEEDFL